VSPALFTSPRFASSKLPTSKYVGVVPEVPSSPVVDLINNFFGEVELSATNSHGKTWPACALSPKLFDATAANARLRSALTPAPELFAISLLATCAI